MKLSRSFAACLLAVLAGNASAQVINLEIDYMAVPGGHSHKPQPDEISALIQMFACQGWTLNVVVSDELTHVNVMRCSDLDDDFFTCTDPNSFKTIKDDNFDHTGGGWHYCIFGHDYNNGEGTGSSGLGEPGGDDFVVTLGDFGNPFNRASTLAHELGHNLGLTHNPSALGGDFTPVYASIMSYQFQFSGVRSRLECLGLTDGTSLFKEIDYSHGRLPFVFESALDEQVGVGIHHVDWNCDGSLTTFPVVQDLDEAAPWCGSVGPVTILADYNDWGNIASNADSPGPDRPYEYEICAPPPRPSSASSEHLQAPASCTNGLSSVTTEACVSGLMIWVDPSSVGLGTGTGSDPYNHIFVAYGFAPDDSVLYLQPGTFTNSGMPITMNRPITLAGPGGAVIDP